MYVVGSQNFKVNFSRGSFNINTQLLTFSGSIWPITIQSPDEFLEGEPSKVTCTALYTCPQHAPVFKWSYGSMPVSNDISKIENAKWRAESTLTFTASANDNGRSLTCFVQFTDNQRQEASVTVWVKSELKLTAIKKDGTFCSQRLTYNGIVKRMK